MTSAQRLGATVAVVLALLTLRCTPEVKEVPATQLIVHLISQQAVRDKLQSLRLRTAFPGAERWSARADATYEVSTLKWPVDLVLVARNEAEAGTHFEVIAEGLDEAGTVLLQARALTSFVRRQTRVLTVELAPCGARPLGELCESEPDCFGPSCKTCVAGECAPTPLSVGDDLPRSTEDAGTNPIGVGDEDGGLQVPDGSIEQDGGNSAALDSGARGSDAAADMDATGSGLDAMADASAASDASDPSDSQSPTCPSGYEPTAAGGGCADIDECMLPSKGACPLHAMCSNRPGKRDCVCDQGYSDVNGDGSVCKNLCENACDPVATCAVVNASPTCSCPPAYTTADNGKTCSFDASCSLLSCDANAKCVVSVNNTRSCECRTGYRGTGTTCTNIVECQETPTICGANTVCTDTLGGYTCACAPDYENKGSGCQKIDDCANAACGAGASACEDGVNTRRCTCRVGYGGTGTTQCTDINECASGNGGCDPRVSCTNTAGGRTCGACPAGFTGTGDSGCREFWPVRLGTAARDTGGDITLVGSNVYMAGRTEGALGGPAQREDGYLVKYDAAGQRLWLQQVGSMSDDSFSSIASDANGNIFVGGSTLGSLDGDCCGGGPDGLVAKYNAAGQQLWLHMLGGEATDSIYGIAADPSGNLFVVGDSNGGFNGHAVPFDAEGRFQYDGFLVKYNAAGVVQWSQWLATLNIDRVYDVATDTQGSVYIAALTDGNSTTMTGDVLLIKYNGAGQKQWSVPLGSRSVELKPNEVATDASGNIYVAGLTTAALGGQPRIGKVDLFVTKFNSTGTALWSRLLGSSEDEWYANLAVASDGSVYLSGPALASVDDHPMQGLRDMVVAKYNAAGAKQWSKQIGAPNAELGSGALAADASSLYLEGFTEGDLAGTTSLGGVDAFILKFDSAGNLY